MHWRRKWQPTPVFLPGESQGRGSLVGCRLWGSHRVGHNWSDLAAAVVWPLYLGIWQEPQKCVVQNQSVITRTCFLPNPPCIPSLHPFPCLLFTLSVSVSSRNLVLSLFSATHPSPTPDGSEPYSHPWFPHQPQTPMSDTGWWSRLPSPLAILITLVYQLITSWLAQQRTRVKCTHTHTHTHTYIFTHLTASGPSCSTWDHHWVMWDLLLWLMGSWVVAGELTSCSV